MIFYPDEIILFFKYSRKQRRFGNAFYRGAFFNWQRLFCSFRRTAAAGEEQTAMNTAELLVRCLENEGVRFVFGIPGEENLEIMKALHHSKIRFITTRHEQGAAFMADVYGRLTGKAGVCLSTLGPGATNLVTGVADANSDGAPLIAITGQVGTERMHLTSHQYLDLVGMFEPITKRSKQIVRPDTTNEIVRIAFKYAESEKPGASYIDLPCDIAAMEVPEGPGRLMLTHHRAALELPDEDSVAQAASMIREAKHPLILAGHSAVRNNASGALRMFADKLSVPVVTTMMAKGVVPDSDQNCVGTIGIPETDYPDKALVQADLVIAVGYDIVEFAPRKWNGDSSHRIIHIDERATHVNKLYQPEIEVIGDISACLEKIAEQCSPCPEPLWAYNIRRERLEDAGRFTDDVSYPVKPQKVISDIRRVLADDDILLCDVGAHKMWVARDYPCEEPKTCIISNGFATMGIAVPGAVAAKLIYPDKKILAVTGDGGFLMNCQELETAVRIGTNFVTLIFHDGSYGLIKWKQENRYHESYDVDFGNPDFVKLAESFGCKGYRISRTEDLLPVLADAFRQKVPSVIDCPVDYRENLKLSEQLQALSASLR